MAGGKAKLLDSLQQRFGRLRKFALGNSLFEVGRLTRFYVRYSRLHKNGRAFFGLRACDLASLHGQESFVCLATDSPNAFLVLPFTVVEKMLKKACPARDGSYKLQVSFEESAQIVMAGIGHLPVEEYRGLAALGGKR